MSLALRVAVRQNCPDVTSMLSQGSTLHCCGAELHRRVCLKRAQVLSLDQPHTAVHGGCFCSHAPIAGDLLVLVRHNALLRSKGDWRSALSATQLLRRLHRPPHGACQVQRGQRCSRAPGSHLGCRRRLLHRCCLVLELCTLTQPVLHLACMPRSRPSLPVLLPMSGTSYCNESQLLGAFVMETGASMPRSSSGGL